MVKKRKMTHLFWGFQRYYTELKWFLGVRVAFVVSVVVVNQNITKTQNTTTKFCKPHKHKG
jgi:hypothetical protein